jgi:hypothetical protein
VGPSGRSRPALRAAGGTLPRGGWMCGDIRPIVGLSWLSPSCRPGARHHLRPTSPVGGIPPMHGGSAYGQHCHGSIGHTEVRSPASCMCKPASFGGRQDCTRNIRCYAAFAGTIDLGTEMSTSR